MKLEGVPERGVGSGRRLTYHFAQARAVYLQSLKLGNKASGPRADLCSHFSICKAGIGYLVLHALNSGCENGP